MKVHVIYHRDDFDGLFSGAVCYYWLMKQGHDVVLQGWDFGDPILHFEPSDSLYIVDLPLGCAVVHYHPGSGETTAALHRSPVVWIDHHKSSIEKSPTDIPGYRIDGVAACRLAWQYFSPRGQALPVLPDKQAYIDRKVEEPLALTLVGEHDVWDHHDPRAEQLQFGLYSDTDWTPQMLADAFLNDATHYLNEEYVETLCIAGEAIMKWQKVFASQVCKSRGYYVELGGNRYWALASVHARDSSWFPNETVPEDCNGLLCYRIEGDGNVKVSLYNREGCESVDHSVIAVAHGGGGHKGACGFSMTLGQAIVEGIVK